METLVCGAVHGRRGCCEVCERGIFIAAVADPGISRGPGEFNVACGSNRRGVEQPGDFEVADGFAPRERKPLGMGRVFHDAWLMPRLMHARLELCASVPALVPEIGTRPARDGISALDR